MKLTALTLIAFACANAAPLTVLNPGFESASLTLVGNGNFSQLVPGSTISGAGGTLDHWTVAYSGTNTTAGGFKPDTKLAVNWPAVVWTGNNIAYLQTRNMAKVSLSQSLADNLLDHTAYTLTVDIGRRNYGGFNYEIALFAGAAQLASASNLKLLNNTSFTDSLIYNSGAANPLAGSPLSIVLRINSVGSGDAESFFDQVRLDAVTTAPTGVPEPSTAVAAGLARNPPKINAAGFPSSEATDRATPMSSRYSRWPS
jgi:hypothetical protein